MEVLEPRRMSRRVGAPRRKRKVMLHQTAVAAVLKEGAYASIRGTPRVTAKAVIQTTKMAESMLKKLGSDCQELLQYARKKTVEKDTILAVMEKQSCTFGQLLGDVRASGPPASRRGSSRHHEPISMASALKAFKQGIPLGRGAYRMSEDAKYALSKVTQKYIQRLGLRAGDFASAGNRVTLSSGDVAHAAQCLA